MAAAGQIEDVGVRYEFTGDVAGQSARVRRAKRREDGRTVRIKVTGGDFPSTEDLAQLRHEHALLAELRDAPVAHALELVRVGNGLGLVLEDAGEQSFDRLFPAGAGELGRWLRLAIDAASALEAVHARGVLHKDIKPQHFFRTDAERVLLIDFSIATTVAQEEQRPDSLDALEGTLSYIAPEQTGRMNRAVDRRSDLYSFGATLYQTLTGALPFAATDPLELVHCHIARFPAPPCELNPQLPRVLSDLVMRLLAKVAEDRYQTATGVKEDLRRCLEQLEAHGRVEPFPLGQHDQYGALRIPQKLYGRADALRALLEAFAAAKAGPAGLILITGGSGIGKSALVHELHKELVRGGQFITGKFDQFNRSVPYSAVAQACADLVQAQLAAPPAVLSAWTERVRAALGVNARVVIDIVPALELVVGEPPPVAAVGPSESQHRFERTFQRFLSACAAPDRPLVLFLDDLQWADVASLRLLKLVLGNPEQHHLLCIGNYRDREVDAMHPLTHFVEEVAARVAIDRIELLPLRLAEVTELLSDTLPQRAGELAPLAQLITRKTGGNPFFVGQFLQEINRQGLLAFDAGRRTWHWDLAAIDAARVTDNVVDLVLEKLVRLDPETQSILKLAACVGHRFDSRHLAAVSGSSPREVADCLWQALEQGFVVPLDKNYRLLSHHGEFEERAADELTVRYRFTHDRVQQAAYALIQESERTPLHLRIGRLLLQQAPEGPAREEQLFEIVGHLNQGRAGMTDAGERSALAQLNLRAALRAKDAGAPATALELADVVESLLGTDRWQADHERAYAAQLIRAECGYVSGNAELTLSAIAKVEQHARTPLQRVPARNLRTLMLTNQTRLVEASAESVDTIRLLGVEMPDQTDKAAIGQAIGREFGAFQGALAGRSIESLADIPPMTDPEKLALINTYKKAIPAAFQWNPELMVLIVLKAVQLPLSFGTAPVSCFFYEQYGIVHAVVTGDYATSYRFGQLGIRVSERPDHAAARGAVHFIFAGFNSPWRRPLAESVEHFRLGMRTGMDAGDPMHAHYCLGVGSAYRFYAGESLRDIEADFPGYVEVLTAANDRINLAFIALLQQTFSCLAGKTKVFGRMDDESFSEAAFEAAAPPPIKAMYGAKKALVRYLGGFAREALDATETFHPLPVLFYNADYKFYHALSLAELARRAELSERAELMQRLKADVQVHAGWASGCPQSFAHRHSLLRAEFAMLEGKGEAAMDAYEQAIGEAAANGFPQHVALANELCARYHYAQGRKKVAKSYFVEAAYHYERWGATGKAAQLAEQYPDLDLVRRAAEPMQTTRHLSARTRTRSATGTSAGDGGLDLLSAMRAAQAITSELELDRLIERLLRILVENAGARRGCLLLPEGDDLVVSAAISVDPDRVELGLNEPLAQSTRLPASIVQYVARSKESVALDTASEDKRFAQDAYLSAQPTKSVATLPFLHQGKLSAILYLENAAVAGVFHAGRLERLHFLGAHAAVAIENAKLYGQVQAARRSLEEANEGLEQKVRSRTAALSQRNDDMRRVLDNVTQGLITLDLGGKVSVERSAAADRWFGPFAVDAGFADHMRRYDAHFADWFAVSFQTLLDGFITIELALAQLPVQLRHAGREYRCSYSAIRSGTALSGLLVVISDETEALAFAREEQAQKEQLALCQRVARDRSGVLGFFEEGRDMLGQMYASQQDLGLVKRLLHTLKGNAGLLGLGVLAERCHQAEERLAEHGDPGRALAAVQERWDALSEMLDLLLGRNHREHLEVPRAELQGLVDAARAGVPSSELLDQLRRLQLEPLERSLLRLGKHAQGLSERLGKGSVQLDVDSGGLFIDPEQSRGFWLALVHIIRNAVDHGFEGADERVRAAKPIENRLHLQAACEADRVRLQISDDGRGIDWERVRALAAARGLPQQTREQLATALLTAEVSTRSEVTATSGRGVGLAAVNRDIGALGGTLAVESEPGHGCTWTISVPAARLGVLRSAPTSGRRPRHSRPPPPPQAAAGK